MTKTDLFEWAEMTGETIDTAVPQNWADAVNKLGIESREFAWHYPKDGGHGGKPISNGELLIKAIYNGNLVPMRFIESAIELAAEGKPKEEIMALIKLSCDGL